MKRCILALLGLLSALPAMAEVIYRWHTVIASPDLPAFDAVLRISDDAYRRGSAYIDFTGCSGIACGLAGDNAGILDIGFSLDGRYFGHKPPQELGVFDRFDLYFDPVGGVTGTISYNSTEIELAMAGHSLWTVNTLRGDPFIGTQCGTPIACSGTSGYFLAESLPLPEPPAWWLMLAGLAAWGLAHRSAVHFCADIDLRPER